jgi:hypothetical protein
MPARWEIINGVKYPVQECNAPDEDLTELFDLAPRMKSREELEKSKKLRQELADARRELERLKEKKKLEKENAEWERLAWDENARLKEDARQQCLELVDDTLPPGVNLTQDEDGWGGAWKHDFLQEANEYWDSLSVDGETSPNNKGNNVSTSPTSFYNIAASNVPGLYLFADLEFDTELVDGCDIVSAKKLFGEMVVHWFEGHKKLGGLSPEEWRDYGFWGSSKFAEMKESPFFEEVRDIFEEMKKEVQAHGVSKFFSKGAPIKVYQAVQWPVVNRLFEGYKLELPKKFSFNAHAPAFVPGNTFTAQAISV